VRKYHVQLIIKRSTGEIRSAPISLRAAAACITLLLGFPVLIGLGAKFSANAEIRQLRTRHAMLEAENASYRSAANAFTEQIRALESVVNDLQLNSDGARRVLTAQGVAALNRGRTIERHAARDFAVESAVLLPALSTPQETLDVLRNILQVLGNRLPSIERIVRRREALAAAAPSIWPTQGWLTAPFGVRNDPLTGNEGFHQGIDISTAEGQPVYATADGVVETAAYSGDYGNMVVLTHNFGLSTRYGHLSRFAVATGADVKRGEVIGYVGATGRATGSHVHYEVLVNGTPIDPLQILTAAIRS
jgi:murein DD-endopeptidase MepM/ murein hydrolase activator NlpD